VEQENKTKKNTRTQAYMYSSVTYCRIQGRLADGTMIIL